jgi:integrase
MPVPRASPDSSTPYGQRAGLRGRSTSITNALAPSWRGARPRRWLANNPLDGTARAKGGRQSRRCLRRAYTPDELARLFAAAPDRRRIVYEVAAYSGLRREELRRLQKCDCDPTGPRPRWHLRPEVSKNGQAWSLPMLRECAAVLRPLWEALPSPDGLIFGAGRGEGTPRPPA